MFKCNKIGQRHQPGCGSRAGARVQDAGLCPGCAHTLKGWTPASGEVKDFFSAPCKPDKVTGARAGLRQTHGVTAAGLTAQPREPCPLQTIVEGTELTLARATIPTWPLWPAQHGPWPGRGPQLFLFLAPRIMKDPHTFLYIHRSA